MLGGGLANQGLKWLFDQFGQWAVDWSMAGFSKFVEYILETVTGLTGDFWNEPVIEVFLNFSMTINFIVLTFSLLFFCIEIAQQSGRVNWLLVFSNFAKVTIFIFFNRYIGLASIALADILTVNLNFSMEAPKPSEIIAGIDGATGLIAAALLLIILLVAFIAFFLMSMLRNGTMFVQILSSSFYIPGILSGDNARLGDWMRQSVAISGTYILQYYMFYLGLTYYATSLLTALTFWASMFAVPKILEKFGYPSGAGGILSAAGSMAGAGLTLVR